MLGNIIVITMNGITAFAAPFIRPVFPHISPKAAKRKPDIPIVGAETYIGRKLAAMAISKEGIAAILFFMLHSTVRLIVRWNTLAWQKV